MSKATKRKHVAKEVLDDYVVPDPNQQIVKILGGRGNNLHEVETSDGKKFLVSMPSKFRKSVWIKRGDFVIVDPIEEGNKVCAEMVHILYGKQIKYLKNEGLWPLAFADKASTDEKADDKQINSNVCEKNINGVSEDEEDRDEDYDDEDDDDLFVNPNHQKTTYYVESQSSDNSDNEE
ncbi:probable RNA-binding protein EIF1AD [Stylophora pistillata]|uniref:Probable RNA-binding protein EIF1AD n=1 Tax=Stylophora pistillata TaxID=50429 RepID=A0A2B4RM95_STYPI|nr:probable RNA-binding protein EIF1AD [Stylophora pistillata]PFX17448.1 putative RNA-binding protein EIF1AD [Stylophora pistillata]